MSDPFAAMFAMVERSIRDPGWAVIAVGGEFAYTVGLTAYNHPEIIIAGAFPPTMLQGVLNSAGRLVKGGAKLEHGGWYDTIIQNFQVPFLQVRDEHAGNLSIAHRVYGQSQKVTALQMFLPDPNGFYPDDTECQPGYRDQQKGWCIGKAQRRSLH